MEIDDAESISQRETATAITSGLGQDELEWLDPDDDGNVVERP
ncbi:hypothetical protein ABQF35_30585 [Mycobacterium syngnathidarum]